jgi:hypothetical protein
MERSTQTGLVVGDELHVIYLFGRVDYSKSRTEIRFELSGTWDPAGSDETNEHHRTDTLGVFPTIASAQEALDEWKKTESLCPECLKGKRPVKVNMEIPTIKELLVVFAAPKEQRLSQKPRFVGI